MYLSLVLFHVSEGVLISVDKDEVMLVDMHSAPHIEVLWLVIYHIVRVRYLTFNNSVTLQVTTTNHTWTRGIEMDRQGDRLTD